MAADIAAVLTASITDFKAKMAEADVSLKTMADSGSSNMSKLSSIGKGALLGIGAAIIGVGFAAVDFGDKLEMSQNQLQAALKAAGISWDQVKGSVNAAGQEAQHYGFTQAEVDAALTKGIISTQNYASAHRNLAIAIELAAARHVDLSQAMQVVDKAAIGQTRALKQMGIDLAIPATNAEKLKKAQEALSQSTAALNLFLLVHHGVVAEGSKDYPTYIGLLGKAKTAQQNLSDQQNAGNEILDALSKRLKGQAAAAADTFQGRLAAVRAEGENLTAQLGLRLIPVLEQIISVIMSVVNWFIQHKAAAEAVGIAIGVLVAGPLAAYIAGMAAAAVETVIATAPILAIIAVAAAVGVAIFELATHWHQVWTDIKNWTDDATSWIRDHWYIIMNIPIVGWLLVLAANWKSVFNDVKAAVTDAWGVIQPIFNFIRSAIVDQIQAAIVVFGTVWSVQWDYIKTVISGAKDVISAITAAISFAIGAITTVINALKDAWSAAWNAIGGALSAIWNNTIKPVIDAINAAIGGVEAALNALKSIAPGSGSVGQPNFTQGGNNPVVPGAGQPTVAHALFIPSADGTAASAASLAGSSGGGQLANVQLMIDGALIGQVLVPILQTAFLQAQRSQVSLGFQ